MIKVNDEMNNSRSLIDDIKKDLARSKLKDRKMTSKNIIEELVEDIHTQLMAGSRLDDVYEIIKKKLPDEVKMSLSTFKRYWREARDDAGLSKIKNSGRKKKEPLPSTPEISNRDSSIKQTSIDTKKLSQKDTSSDFREDPENI
jgi:uncharacterized short protein YbdD (DUF466 family)